MNLKKELSLLLESVEMRKCFLENYDSCIIDEDKTEMIDGARRSIYDKLALLRLLPDTKENISMIKAYEFAIENTEHSNPGDVFIVGEYDMYCGKTNAAGFSPYLSFAAAADYVKKEAKYAERLYQIEKYTPPKNNCGEDLTLVITYFVSQKGEVLDFDCAGHTFAFNGVKPPLGLPHPFRAGDIVKLDCTPFLPVKAAVIIEQPKRNWGCCFPQIAYVSKCGEIETGALKHLRAYSDVFDCFWAVSPMYRLQTYTEELPENEQILKKISKIIQEHPEAAYDMSYGNTHEWEKYDTGAKGEKKEFACNIEIASDDIIFTFEDNEGYSYDRYGVKFNHDKTKLIQGVSGLNTYRIPDTVIEIGEKAFYFPEATDMEFIIPEGVKIIGDSAFFLSPNGIDLPQSITTLGCSPFCCSFTVGKNVSEIAEGVSMYDDPIYVDPENPNFVIYDDALYSKDMKRLLHVFTKKEAYVIPDGVERVDMWAFCGTQHVQKLHIPSSVRYIGCGALPDELENISVSPDNPNFCVVNGALFEKVHI